MFDFLNAVYSAAIHFFQHHLYPVGETTGPTQLDDAVELRFVRKWWRDDGDAAAPLGSPFTPELGFGSAALSPAQVSLYVDAHEICPSLARSVA